MASGPGLYADCPGHLRHWFAYRGAVGSSSPVCVRGGCGAPNPNYRRTDDPYAEQVDR